MTETLEIMDKETQWGVYVEHHNKTNHKEWDAYQAEFYTFQYIFNGKKAGNNFAFPLMDVFESYSINTFTPRLTGEKFNPHTNSPKKIFKRIASPRLFNIDRSDISVSDFCDYKLYIWRKSVVMIMRFYTMENVFKKRYIMAIVPLHVYQETLSKVTKFMFNHECRFYKFKDSANHWWPHTDYSEIRKEDNDSELFRIFDEAVKFGCEIEHCVPENNETDTRNKYRFNFIYKGKRLYNHNLVIDDKKPFEGLSYKELEVTKRNTKVFTEAALNPYLKSPKELFEYFEFSSLEKNFSTFISHSIFHFRKNYYFRRYLWKDQVVILIDIVPKPLEKPLFKKRYHKVVIPIECYNMMMLEMTKFIKNHKCRITHKVVKNTGR